MFNFLALQLLMFAFSSFAAAQQPATPAAPAVAPAASAAEPKAAAPAEPKAVPPEEMTAKALVYPNTVVRQEIEIGSKVVPAVISQMLAGMATGSTHPSATDTARLQEMLSAESVRAALNGMVRLLVVVMAPVAATAPAASTGGAEAPKAASAPYCEGDKAASYYGDLFAQYKWTSAIRTVEPQLRKSFHLLLAPEAKGLFFVVADQYGITTVLALSDTSLTPLLDVLAPILGRGIFPTGLPTPSPSTETAPAP